MYDLEKLHYEILRIQERLDNLENKQWFRTQINEHIRILNSEYSNRRNDLIKEFGQYSPKTQLNIKKMLLKGLPEKPMKMAKYMAYIKDFILQRKIVGFNLAEYEVLLHRLDLVSPKDEIDRARIDSKILSLIIDVL